MREEAHSTDAFLKCRRKPNGVYKETMREVKLAEIIEEKNIDSCNKN